MPIEQTDVDQVIAQLCMRFPHLCQPQGPQGGGITHREIRRLERKLSRSSGGGGETCCAPQLLAQDQLGGPESPLRFQLLDSTANQEIHFNAGDCGLDEPLTAIVLSQPPNPGTLPLISGQPVVTPQSGTSPATVTITFDTTNGASGDFILQVTNDCGCCTILYGEVVLT